METSQSITNIAKALLVFQGKVDKIKKDSTNPFFKSKYASLSTIQDEIQLPLAEAGLCYSQHPEIGGHLTTLVIHAESGEFFKSVFDLNPIKSDPQSLGSAITYGKRYALVAILGLNIDDDDDGNHASGKKTEPNGEIKQPVNGEPVLPPPVDNRAWLNQKTEQWTEAVNYLNTPDGSIAKIEKKYRLSKENKSQLIKEAQEALAVA